MSAAPRRITSIALRGLRMLSSAIKGTLIERRTSAMPSRSCAGSGCSTNSRFHGSIARIMRIACLAFGQPMFPSTRSFTSGPMAGAHALACELRHLLRLAERHRIAERNAVSHLPAEQVVDRRIQGFPDDVPKRHLDTGLRLLDAVESRVHLLNQARDPKRILADHRRHQDSFEIVAQQVAAALEHAGDLADPRYAGIRIDEHDRVIRHRSRSERGPRDAAKGAPARAPDRDRSDPGNLHSGPRRHPLTKCSELSMSSREMSRVQMTKTWPKPTVQSLPDQVTQTILARIAAGELRPGHRLPAQRELAESMGVGLAVIREAMQRLEALNVVEASHGSGTVIRPFRWMPLIYSPALFVLAMQRIGIRDLWETRRLLEGQVIRLAVERATRANLDAMRAILERAEPLPENYERSQGLNREFHLALARSTQNAVLEDLIAPLLDVHTQGVAHRFTQDHCRLTWDAHQAIYDAVAARDAVAADRAIAAHFEVGPIALAEIEARSREMGAPRRRKRTGS